MEEASPLASPERIDDNPQRQPQPPQILLTQCPHRLDRHLSQSWRLPFPLAPTREPLKNLGHWQLWAFLLTTGFRPQPLQTFNASRNDLLGLNSGRAQPSSIEVVDLLNPEFVPPNEGTALL